MTKRKPTLGEVLGGIKGKARGALKERDVLRAAAILIRAKDRKSPLHGFFEWNDRKAAQSFRGLTAMNMAREFERYERNQDHD